MAMPGIQQFAFRPPPQYDPYLGMQGPAPVNPYQWSGGQPQPMGQQLPQQLLSAVGNLLNTIVTQLMSRLVPQQGQPGQMPGFGSANPFGSLPGVGASQPVAPAMPDPGASAGSSSSVGGAGDPSAMGFGDDSGTSIEKLLRQIITQLMQTLMQMQTPQQQPGGQMPGGGPGGPGGICGTGGPGGMGGPGGSFYSNSQPDPWNLPQNIVGTSLPTQTVTSPINTVTGLLPGSISLSQIPSNANELVQAYKGVPAAGTAEGREAQLKEAFGKMGMSSDEITFFTRMAKAESSTNLDASSHGDLGNGDFSTHGPLSAALGGFRGNPSWYEQQTGQKPPEGWEEILKHPEQNYQAAAILGAMNIKAGMKGENGKNDFQSPFTGIITQHQKGYASHAMSNPEDGGVVDNNLRLEEAGDSPALKAFYAELRSRLPHSL